jgi:hypothetical protein
MKRTKLQNNDTQKDAVTEENIQHSYGSLPKNINAIKIFAKKKC